jgi:hypothetical protein
MRRRPTITAVKAAADTLARAAMAEADRIREEQGHAGHVAAQELEHQAVGIGSLASRIEQMRARS